jgi:hypothetical protein
MAAVVSLIRSRAAARDQHWLAHRVEEKYPELRSALLAAIEQRPSMSSGRLGYLQESVVRQALDHARHHHGWERVAAEESIDRSKLQSGAALAAMLLAMAGWQWLASPGDNSAEANIVDAAQRQGRALEMTVEPGSTEVERGSSLLVLARFAGALPAEATLVFQPQEQEKAQLSMAKSLEDPVFAVRVPVVDAPLEYHVQLPGQRSESYQVTVFEYPRLVRADARLKYPSYTGLQERLVEDVRTVSAVEGTELTLICHLNKPVDSALFTDKADRQAKPLVLAASPDDPSRYEVAFRCESSRRLQLTLVDDQGRRNQKPAEIAINVLPNKPPDLKLVMPARDVEVSPLEELDVKANAWDDYGLSRYGLSYAIAGKDPVELVLGEKGAGKERREMASVIRFEELEAAPDELLSYHFWAEDVGPDGKVRRTLGDMYFAEVRPFEEIFRQGQQPPGGQSEEQQQQGGQNARQAEELARLQKDIINATWKLVRRETSGQPSDKFADDVKLIHESQMSAFEQATELVEKLEDPQSREHAQAVLEAMTKAIDQLSQAQQQNAAAPLTPALAAEQAAYQALLKLRAREHRVIRGQRSQSASASSSSNSRSQQQLNQLQLDNEENRYETQRTAQAQQQSQEDRETRQVLNRLSELARRQNDLNERLKELQAALEEARNEEEKEEIRRQLKRLREEQQQILRDTDELRSRMETPENQERMEAERQQLEQTREQVRQASEALEQEQVTQAASAGTRAERDFQELRNEFRRRASNRFGEEMRQLRDEARELDQRQQDLSQQLADLNKPEQRSTSLRGDDRRNQIPGELAEQKERLEELLDEMRQTVQEAEATEPLLSEQLYDTVRNADERNLDRALEAAELSMRRGLTDDARQQEEVARRGIGQLREGVEKAAESVLGDDQEALRRARQELDQLADELQNEIARNTGQPESRPGGDPSPSDAARNGQNQQPSQPGDPPGQQRQPQPGQQPGQQPGEQQPMPGEAQQQRSQQPGRQPAQQSGQQTGQQSGEQQPMPGQQGQQTGQQQGQQQGQQPGQQPQQGQRGGQRLAGANGPGVLDQLLNEQPGQGRQFAPLTGESFTEWSDRLRDVEEMVEDPQLRAEAARIRDQARSIRAEFKRHSKLPDWDLVQVQVAGPLMELRNRVAEELLRRTSKDAALPLDRDPVPPRYSEKTRLYYERLGSGQ